jgi:hypothetical protein
VKDTKGWGEKGMKFDWQFDEDVQPGMTRARPRHLRRWFLMLLPIFLLTLITWGWNLAQSRADSRLIAEIQTQLIAEQTALANGDVELLRTLYHDDPGLFAAAFPPIARTTPTAIQDITTQGDELWVTITWADAPHTWQRLLFFQRQEAQLMRRATSAAFWGDWQESMPQDWGQLVLTEADAAWEEAITQFVDTWLAEQCHPCLTDQLPFTLTIAPDWQLTAAPGEVRVPSPHLVALDMQGQPGQPFWQLLEARLADYLTPAVIQFAVPGVEPGVNWEYTYRLVADQFEEANPTIQVELVVVDKNTPLATVLPDVDGAALPLDAAALRAGLVQDLTDLAVSDPNFVSEDFYEQIWQGAYWQERVWLMPQSAQMRLLFYDVAFYEASGLPFPTLDWTWAEWQAQMATLRQRIDPDTLFWPYLDTSADTLLAYAYNWDNRCDRPHSIHCSLRWQPAQVAAALTWYTQLTPHLQPDLTTLSPAEQQFLALNLVSIPRQVAVWVSVPGRYELEFSLGALGVMVFPGTETHPGITPLQVQGSVMSASSTRPRAVWAWLKFLSYQPLDRGRRDVPARPSVANGINYWQTLIPPLRQPMLTAFAHGRPILLSEQGAFPQAQLQAVLTGEMAAFAAANSTFSEP